ncbi:MAG: hypothetical protein ACOYPR_09015, partial [Saprospiraceae bacterium]
MQTSIGTNPSTPYAGAGYSPDPTTAGRLNSNAWAIAGWSDGSVAFGGTGTTGDFARGATSAAQTTGGNYGFQGAPQSAANPCIMFQPAGSDFNPGSLTLRIQNTGTTNITQLIVSYNLYVRNDQGRSSFFNFSYSADNIAYTPVAALNYTSIEVADALGWVLVGSAPSRSTTITGLNIAPNAFYYIRWSGGDVGGSGSRDEFGLDDINLNATFAGAPVCALASAGLTNVHCEDNNGTGNNSADDYIWFNLNPTGSNLGTGYNVTVNTGSVTLGASGAPTNVSYGVSSAFRLQAGSAGAGNVTVTITDIASGACTITALITDPGSCSIPDPVCNLATSGLATLICNNNETTSNSSDDYLTFFLNPTGTVLSTTYSLTVSSGTVTLVPSGAATGIAYGAATQFRLQNGSAGAGNVTIFIEDGADPDCVLSVPIVDPGSCSVPNCALNVTCPTSPNTVYNCNNPIPAAVTTLAGFQALGGTVTGPFCGTLTFTSNTTAINNCSSTSATRVYTIFDDLAPFNGVKDGNENGSTCILTYNYAPDQTAPTFNEALPANTTIACTDNLPVAPSLTGSDNCSGSGSVPNVIWINEFHYDNTGVDAGEFVEVAGSAGINLSDYQIVLYNGNGGVVYTTTPLSGSIDNEGSGFGAVSFSYPANGIQNGAPDGIALYRVSTNMLIQFLSYEGSFQAVDGPAIGIFSTDIGIIEQGNEPTGLSLQLTGTGQIYSNFTWTGPIAQSPGTLNAGQTINPLPASIAATFLQTEVAGNCAGSRVVTRRWTVTDVCNNAATHTQIISVVDNQAPVLTPTPANITLSCSDPIPPAPAVVGTDGCDPAGIINGPVWINELHYDNTGNDVNEFVEIAGRAGTNLSGYELFFYNGSTGMMGGTYGSLPLSGIIANQSNGFGTIAFFLPVNGIENGPSDGIAFVKGGTVLQFLSYEGVMTAIGGPANGQVSTDIGVAETGNEPVGQSVRLSGNGATYASFVWNNPSAAAPATPGQVNQGQTFPAQPANGLPVTFAQTTTPGSCPSAQVIKRTWSTTDACGNTAVYTQTISTTDASGPVVTCPANVTVNLAINGTVTVSAASLGVTAVDNCGTSTLGTNTLVLTCANQGQTTPFVSTATDQCGNTGTCTTQVFVANFTRCTPKILITDPCVCKNNATNLTNGQFGEVIKIESITGKVWTVTAVTGLFSQFSPAPP